jgi:hypothetical protein
MVTPGCPASLARAAARRAAEVLTSWPHQSHVRLAGKREQQ